MFILLLFCKRNSSKYWLNATTCEWDRLDSDQSARLIELAFVLRKNMYVLALSQRGKQGTKQKGLHRRTSCLRQLFRLITKERRRVAGSLRYRAELCVSGKTSRESIY